MGEGAGAGAVQLVWGKLVRVRLRVRCSQGVGVAWTEGESVGEEPLRVMVLSLAVRVRVWAGVWAGWWWAYYTAYYVLIDSMVQYRSICPQVV